MGKLEIKAPECKVMNGIEPELYEGATHEMAAMSVKYCLTILTLLSLPNLWANPYLEIGVQPAGSSSKVTNSLFCLSEVGKVSTTE